MTRLGPPVLKHALAGTLAPSITLNDLLSAAAHLDWDRQAKSIGLDCHALIAHANAKPTAA